MTTREFLSNFGFIGFLVVIFLIYQVISHVRAARMSGESGLGLSMGEKKVGDNKSGSESSLVKMAYNFLFGFDGSADRGEFAVTQLMGGFLVVVSWSGVWVLLFHGDDFADSNRAEGATLLVAISFLVGFWICLASVARRFRDLGVTAWATVLLFVPALNLALFAVLLFAPSGTLKRVIEKPTI